MNCRKLPDQKTGISVFYLLSGHAGAPGTRSQQQVPCAHGRPIPLQPETYSLLSRLIFAHRIGSEIVPVVVIMVPPLAKCSRFPPEQLMLPLLHSLLPCR